MVVCKTAFCSLHAVVKCRVHKLAIHAATNVFPRVDQRGQHSNRPQKITDKINKQIEDYVISFPHRSSHYSRKESKWKYLSSELNIKRMWMSYLEKHEPEIIWLMKANKDCKPHVMYFVPFLTTNEVFMQNKSGFTILVFTHAQIIVETFYMYDETTARKGSTETNTLSKDVNSLYLFTDNCTGQNQNSLMVWFLLTLLNRKILSRIVHNLPEHGHSFLPCDQDFAHIKKRNKMMEVVYAPEQWYEVEEGCGKNFHVNRVSQNDVLDLKTKLQPYFKKSETYNGRPFSISKYKKFIYDKKYLDEVLVSESHAYVKNEMEKYKFLKVPLGNDALQAQHSYDTRLPLNPLKYYDVMKLDQKYVPPVHFPFYENLNRVDAKECDDDDE
ncbi:hypothetical protein PR048_008884 [Dryococelus australis]|uniref:DUF7869 domain-containing protein n=1 Tax=Dryococelus australis TaxID=614101 RepID=A0ABQ9HYD3_9NEOP|nr:hypothetical protein PR048_008884 [Dryococelus australis]